MSGEEPEVTSEIINPDAVEASFKLSIDTEQNPSNDIPGVYVIKARLMGDRLLWDRIGQLDLWWNTPSGVRTRFEMRPFGEGIWVSRVAVGLETGSQKLSLVAILRGSGEETTFTDESGVDEVWEDDYQLEMPSMELSFLNRRRISDDRSISSPVLDELEITKKNLASGSSGTSIALITLLIGLTNVFLLAMLGGARLVMAHLPRIYQRFQVDANQAVPIHEKMHEIFTQGRLFDEYEEPIEGEDITEDEQEMVPAPGGKLKGLLEKVLSKDTNVVDANEVLDSTEEKNDIDDDIQVNLNDLSF